jgi:hypothetical protein
LTTTICFVRINELNKESVPDKFNKVYEKIVMRSFLEIPTQVETLKNIKMKSNQLKHRICPLL